MKNLLKPTFLLGIFLLRTSCSLADTIHINQYRAQFDDSSTVVRYTYGKSELDTNGHIALFIESETSTTITVYNHLNITVGIAVEGENKQLEIGAGDKATTNWTFTKTGVFKCYDHLSEYGEYMGLTGVIIVSKQSSIKKLFVWNLADFQKSKCEEINAQNQTDFGDYRPEYFTINGRVFPYSEDDPLVKIQGKVGDTLTLVILNSGRANHSIHLHGYHARIISCKQSEFLVNASKDTVPVKEGDFIELEIVPDKPGKYPVHNHSLNGVISNGLYPSGQFSIMSIGI